MKIKEKTTIPFGIIKIKPTLNNIFITLTDLHGNVLISKHLGLLDYKGYKKKTPYVAGLVLKSLIEEMNNLNIIVKMFKLHIKRYTRKSFTQNIIGQLSNLNINNVVYLEYIFAKSHNGMRLKKMRRL